MLSENGLHFGLGGRFEKLYPTNLARTIAFFWSIKVGDWFEGTKKSFCSYRKPSVRDDLRLMNESDSHTVLYSVGNCTHTPEYIVAGKSEGAKRPRPFLPKAKKASHTGMRTGCHC